MRRRLVDILACPTDKNHPLELTELSARGDNVVDGVLVCSECGRYYPIIDEIAVLLPDNLRNKAEDMGFLKKWKDRLPDEIARSGRPNNLAAE